MFVPTNAAFASLPAAALDDLVKNKTKLANLLKYHLYSGNVKYSASMVQAEQRIVTAQGSALVITPEVGTSIKITSSYRLISNNLTNFRTVSLNQFMNGGDS